MLRNILFNSLVRGAAAACTLQLFSIELLIYKFAIFSCLGKVI